MENSKDYIDQIPTITLNNKVWYNLDYITSTSKDNDNLDEFVQTYPYFRDLGYFDMKDNLDYDIDTYKVLEKQIELRDRDRRRKKITLTFDQYNRIFKPNNVIKVEDIYYGDFNVMVLYQGYVAAEFRLFMNQELLSKDPKLINKFINKYGH